MPFQFFSVPIQNADVAASDLNAFLRSHRVLAVGRPGASSFWSFCFDYVDQPDGGRGADASPPSRSKVDYREILSPPEFHSFSQLRELRKQIAQSEAVLVYTIFTNE